MYLSIIILPLLGSIVSGFFGRKVGVRGAQLITCFNVIVTTILAVLAFFEVGFNNIPVSIELFRWIDSEWFNIIWGFEFDSLTVTMLIPVLIISSLVHIYSISYMSNDPRGSLVRGKQDYGEKLPNSGELLKLTIPSHIWKNMCGWANHLCMVIICKMSENEMDNRGSKSIVSHYGVKNTIVKEQREDGSLRIKHLMCIRCSLMGFERNYLANIPSKQYNIQNYSTFTTTQINPWAISGFIDAEGSFSIILDKIKTRKLGWRIQPKFQLGLHIKDLVLLKKIQEFLGGIGSLHLDNNRDRVNFSVNSIKDLLKLIDHLDRYPLISQKAADYLLFKQVIELTSNKTHLTPEGLKEIVNIKASMNLGLSDTLKSEFKGFIPVERPAIVTDNIPHPSWISGFISGEGNFDVRISSSSNKIGYRVQLRFRVSQHERDLILLENIRNFFGTGNVYKYKGKSAVILTIVNFSDITNRIIPFFKENPLLPGIKINDYLDWCKIHKLVEDGNHLTLEGLNLIRELRSGMNTGRK